MCFILFTIKFSWLTGMAVKQAMNFIVYTSMCEALYFFGTQGQIFCIKKKDLHFDIGQLAIGFTMTDRFDLTFSSNGLSSTIESFICVFILYYKKNNISFRIKGSVLLTLSLSFYLSNIYISLYIFLYLVWCTQYIYG